LISFFLPPPAAIWVMGLAFLGFRVQIETLCLFAKGAADQEPCAVRRSIKLVCWIFGCSRAKGYM